MCLVDLPGDSLAGEKRHFAARVGAACYQNISPFNAAMRDGGRTTWRSQPRVGPSGHVSAMHIPRKAPLVPFAYLPVETTLRKPLENVIIM